MTTVLHNSADAASRAFVAALPPDVEVLDWYQSGREAWIARGGTDQVSAFPSVVYDVGPVERRVLRLPADWAEAEAYGRALAGEVVPDPVQEIVAQPEVAALTATRRSAVKARERG